MCTFRGTKLKLSSFRFRVPVVEPRQVTSYISRPTQQKNLKARRALKGATSVPSRQSTTHTSTAHHEEPPLLCGELPRNSVKRPSLPEMLKRQRASSPSPLTQATAMELPLPSHDLTSSEHGAKRRRVLAPPLDGPPRGCGMLSVPLGDELDKDDMMDDDVASMHCATVNKRCIEGADEYKTVNSLLHDLHAEQQHRRLMSPSSHSSSSSSPGPFPCHRLSPSSTGKFGTVPHPSPNFAQDIPLSEKHRQDAHASEAMDWPCGTGDVSVYDWYEEKNRSVWFPLDTSQSPINAFSTGF